ncbi:MAG: ParB/RepB/Spo0J family partition protein [Patescibacteria group bacterium]|nr:ParB/RepB/Spo0J family partition protein [Patescibacteria group bacterium]MDE2438419.1 ParB/RepB/Spo0J family partition protein [Patescibacteria group bacterium]
MEPHDPQLNYNEFSGYYDASADSTAGRYEYHEAVYNPQEYSFSEFQNPPSLAEEAWGGEPVSAVPVFADPEIHLDKVSYVLDPQRYEEPIKEPVFWVETAKVKSNPFQPRKHFDPVALEELAASIREYGILQPIVVSKIEHEGEEAEYQLIAGERRLLASRQIGLEHIPAIIKENREDREKLEMAIIENLQRSELNSIEMARAFARLSDEFGLSQREISHRMGKSREAVSNTIRLLQLPYEAQKALEEHKITDSHARLMLRVVNPEKQRAVLTEILSRNLSVRETEAMVNRVQNIVNSSLTHRQRVVDIDPAVSQLERSLETVFGKPVSVERTGNKGKISISFYSDDELKELIERLVGQTLLTGDEVRVPIHGEMPQEGEPEFTESELQSEFHQS